ncbi:hypothetical protein [Saccharophagus degradans]|uniref:Bacterial surface antigen (D15) domain-containing protein n=1 Tax=Saccharophagus degradans TaxID=86304 RepID=A0AAW7X9X9_9GAMM|nr:hypothetical protein [Saccharophagus degradans]MDO6423328.1 hypothetical protein [Saccharophagus degradans]MDO6606733.1 hypothetical protein [Saccharophagus degradans]
MKKQLFKRKLLYASLLTAASVAAAPVQAEKAQPSNCQPIKNTEAIAEGTRVNKQALGKWKNKKIHKINITINNIFDESDPAENKWIYRLANRIQVNTRENTIRSQLLFKEGDEVDPERIEESLRRLYKKEYLLDVKLELAEQCGDLVTLDLIVRDAWTIEPRISAGHEGGESSSEFGLRDGNFLGSGAELELIYKTDAERSQVDYKYRSENFLNTRWLAEFYHADLSDGENNRVILEKPYYSNNTRWAYGFEVETLTQVDKIRMGDSLLNAYSHVTESQNAYLGRALAINSKRTYRLNVGVTAVDHAFSHVEQTQQLPDAEQQFYHWVEVQRQTNEFKTYTNLNYIKRAEDIAIGQEFSVRVGQGEWAETDSMTRLIAQYSNALALQGNHLFKFDTYTDLVYTNEDQSLANSIWGLSGKYHYYVDGKNRWQIRASWDRGNNLPEYRELTLGEEVGMRGYPLSYQRGDNRYIVNIERRFYSDIHWFNLIRVGAVAFVDAGRAWQTGNGEQADHLASAGLGLRLHSSKSGNPAVIHINLSAPLVKDEQLDDYLVSVAVGTEF